MWKKQKRNNYTKVQIHENRNNASVQFVQQYHLSGCRMAHSYYNMNIESDLLAKKLYSSSGNITNLTLRSHCFIAPDCSTSPRSLWRWIWTLWLIVSATPDGSFAWAGQSQASLYMTKELPVWAREHSGHETWTERSEGSMVPSQMMLNCSHPSPYYGKGRYLPYVGQNVTPYRPL